MQNPASPRRTRKLAGIAAALILIVFGAAAVVKGVDGHTTVARLARAGSHQG